MNRRVALCALSVTPAALLSACKDGKSSGGSPKAGSSASKLESAPGGTVTTHSGEKLELSGLWADKKAVVVFYRGHW